MKGVCCRVSSLEGDDDDDDDDDAVAVAVQEILEWYSLEVFSHSSLNQAPFQVERSLRSCFT